MDQPAAANAQPTEPALSGSGEIDAILRSRDEFLRHVSHELRTPVAVSLVWAHLLREGKVPADQVPQAIAAIEESARDQKRLVDLLGDAARVSSGRVTLSRSPNEIAALLGESLALIADRAEAKGVALEDQIVDVGMASIDADRIRQALSHLLANALRHTPQGGRISVATEGDDRAVRLVIGDSGSGIDARLLPHLFRPTMHAVRAALNEERGASTGCGLGLGLLMAHRLATLHGGDLVATSAGPGRGASFTMTLPRS